MSVVYGESVAFEKEQEPRQKFRFDYTISLGNILSFLVIMFTIISYFNQMEHRLSTIEVKVDKMWQAYGPR